MEYLTNGTKMEIGNQNIFLNACMMHNMRLVIVMYVNARE